MKKKVLMLLALFMAAMTASAMQIFVQTPTGSTITLDVEPSDSFENIKAKIQDKKGYRPELQRLMFGDKVCNDDQTLQDLSVDRESTLKLYILGQNCYSLSIDNTMVNGTLTFSVNDNKDVDFADEDDVITISVSPEEGYAAGTVSAKAYTTWSARRRVAPNIALLGDIEVTPVEGVDTAWTFTMPAASVKASATFKKLSTLAFNPADMTGYMQVNIAGQTATPNQEGKIANVLEGDSVKLTANYGYKFRKVEAKKTGPALKTLTVNGFQLKYVEGDTWQQAIERPENEGSSWKVQNNYIFNGGFTLFINEGSYVYVRPGDTIDATKNYSLEAD